MPSRRRRSATDHAMASAMPSARLPALVLFCGAALTLSGCWQNEGHPVSVAPTSVPSAALAGSVRPTPRPTPVDPALALWKRTLAAARDVSARVQVTETRFATPSEVAAGMQPQQSTSFAVIEGIPATPRAGHPAHYRLQYSAPKPIDGLALVSDGETVWRFDPHTGIAGRYGVNAAPTPPELEEGVAGMPAQADGTRPEIEALNERVAGRTTEVLVLRRATSRRTLERRWIDIATGRTLRLEQYTGRDARLARRVEITDITYLTTPDELARAAALIHPDFPAATQHIDRRSSNTRHFDEAAEVALHAHLPLHVRGFALRSVGSAPGGALSSLKPPGATAMPPLSAPTHLLYTNGDQSISVFVTAARFESGLLASPPSAAPAPLLRNATTPPTTPNWHPAPLDGNRVGYAREIGAGRKGGESAAAVVAWNASEGSYVAVARMPLARLLPVAAAFAADRDDAPSDRGER